MQLSAATSGFSYILLYVFYFRKAIWLYFCFFSCKFLFCSFKKQIDALTITYLVFILALSVLIRQSLGFMFLPVVFCYALSLEERKKVFTDKHLYFFLFACGGLQWHTYGEYSYYKL
jgi:hypothetical protein